jgi:hypothetical protein
MLRILLVFGAALLPLPVYAERWLWPSPTGDTEVVDQAQTTLLGPWVEMQNGQGIGQSFLPAASRLERLDLMLYNRQDRRPFTIRLWEWVDTNANGRADDAEYAATVARAPLWSDRLALAGPPERTLVPFYPRIAVRAGVPHYFELTNDTQDGEFTAYDAQSSSVDTYPRGQARLNGHFLTSWVDLWFKTYSAPAGAPPPLTCEDTGAPAPCFSAPAAWVDPAPPGPPPTSGDYRQIVQQNADYARPYVLAGNGSNASEFALYDAFLYRITHDESYAASSLAMLGLALSWREANPNSAYSLFWAEYPGWAYRWIQASPALDAAAHARVRRLLALHALRLWPVIEGGLDNHALASALTMKLTTDLVPAGEVAAVTGGAATAADHAAWKAFADSEWTEFKKRFDIWEDASQYHYFELRHILELAELYGEESVLWASPAFGALVDRGFAVHTPPGPQATFGDTLGWNVMWGTAAWVFEAAGRWLRAPEYRWLAARVFDYERSHLRPTRLDSSPVTLWQAVYSDYPAFVFAYFAHDETAPIGPPPSFAIASAARQDAVSSATWTSGSTAIGQTFVADATPLVRLELQLRGPSAALAGELRLWRWNGSRNQTISLPPLHAEGFAIATGGNWRSVVFDLLDDLEVGATYLFEVSANGSFDLAGSPQGGIDRYPAGDVWLGSQRKAGGDLWFVTSTFGGSGSTITERPEAVWRRPSQFGTPPWPMDFTGQSVPDKLVLRSGWEPDDLGIVVQLASGDLYHGQEETGAILTLTDRGSLLLSDGTFFDRIDQRQAVPIVRRYTGARRDVVPQLSVSHFRDTLRATVAHLTWGERDGWPVDLERRFLFVKDRFVLVRDRATFRGALEASVGPLWNSYDLDPEHGATWFDLYDREPRMVNGYRFANPERRVLLWTVPRPGVAVESWREVRTGNPPSPAYMVAQRWTGTAVDGQARWFDSLLLPHGPERTPAEAASAVSVLYDDGTAVALRVVIDGEIWTVVDNPAHSPLASVLVSTDASYAITRTRAGEPEYALVRDATYLRVDDGTGRKIERGWLVPSSAEIGGDRLPEHGGRGAPSVRPREVVR